MALMQQVNQRIELQPGAVASGTAITLPAGYQMADVTHAEIQRYDHKHLVGTVTTTAGSTTAPVEFTPGDGTALATTISVGTAAAPGANEDINSSNVTNIPAIVAATPTYLTATTLSLNVATEANDMLALDIIPVGGRPRAQ